MEKCYEHNVDLAMPFIDFRQPFDSTDRNQLFKALEFYGTPAKVIKLIKMMLDDHHLKHLYQILVADLLMSQQE
jgi:hypothetical protein